MRAVVQRVSSATVTVEDRVTGQIGPGVLAFIGVEQGDTSDDVKYIASKIAGLRIFAGDGKGMNRSVADVGGAALVVSQFTLSGDARNGRRPSFATAAAPELARALYEEVVRELSVSGLQVETGECQASMQVALVNDGPVTILLDSRRTF